MPKILKKKINLSLLTNLILACFILVIEGLEGNWLGGLVKLEIRK